MGSHIEDLLNFKGKICPSTDLIDQFEKFDKSKSSTKRNLCYNRAKLWIARLLKREVQVPQAYKLRHEGIQNALDHMFHVCFACGMSPKDYLNFCIALDPTEVKESDSNESSMIPEQKSEVKPNNTKVEDDKTEENFSKSSAETSSAEDAAAGTSSAEKSSTGKLKTGKICKYTWKGLRCQINSCSC